MTSISSLHLSDIASTNVLTVSPEDSIATVISLFAEKRVSSIIVVEHGRPIGIVTERDLLRFGKEPATTAYPLKKPLPNVPHS